MLQDSANSLTKVLRPLIVFALALILAGCQSVMYQPTGNLMINFAKDESVPYALAMSDPLMGCALGTAMSPFLLSFERVDVALDDVAILMNNLSGFCAEVQAWEAELRQIRAFQLQQSAESKDALTAQKRFEALAAQRQYSGYLRLVTAFGEPGQACPEFKNTNEEFYYLVGLMNGLLAAQNNIAAHQVAGVPMSVTSKVGRGAQCLDPEKWWGVPLAIQATVWSMLPNTVPKDENPRALLRRASQLGMEQGVRLSHVFEAEVYLSQSDIPALKLLIKQHAQAIEAQPADVRLKLLDSMATYYIQAMSDAIWTREAGHRTPFGGLGQFWQQQKLKPAPSIDIDDLI